MLLTGHYQLLYPIKLYLPLSTHWVHTVSTEHNKRDVSHLCRPSCGFGSSSSVANQYSSNTLWLLTKNRSYVNVTHPLSSLLHVETKPLEMTLFSTRPELDSSLDLFSLCSSN